MSEEGRRRAQDGGTEEEEEEDLDALLASLTEDEVKELEGDLLVMAPDPGVPVGLRQRNQTDKAPSISYDRKAMLHFCEEETRKLIHRELSIEVWHFVVYFELKALCLCCPLMLELKTSLGQKGCDVSSRGIRVVNPDWVRG